MHIRLIYILLLTLGPQVSLAKASCKALFKANSNVSAQTQTALLRAKLKAALSTFKDASSVAVQAEKAFSNVQAVRKGLKLDGFQQGVKMVYVTNNTNVTFIESRDLFAEIVRDLPEQQTTELLAYVNDLTAELNLSLRPELKGKILIPKTVLIQNENHNKFEGHLHSKQSDTYLSVIKSEQNIGTWVNNPKLATGEGSMTVLSESQRVQLLPGKELPFHGTPQFNGQRLQILVMYMFMQHE